MMTLLAATAPPIDWAGYCGLTPDKQLIWEERSDELNKFMLYLINSNNKHAKKDLCLAYSQRNLTAYPFTIKEMARYLSTQYPNNKPTNQRDGKKGVKQQGDYQKAEDKDSNTGGTAGAHVENTTTPEESATPNGGASVGAHNLETNEQLSRPSRTVEEILGSHPTSDDNFWGGTDPGDVSIDTDNSKEMIVGSHITELHSHKSEEPVPPELLNVVPNEPQTYDLAQNYHLDSWNKSRDSNILSKTNNVRHIKGSNLLSQKKSRLLQST